MKILIDNGHGIDTPGKRSPQQWKIGSQLIEANYTREIAARVVKELKAQNIDAELLTPEKHDVALSERVIRANRIAMAYGKKETFVVSIHVNASNTNGKAHGWEIHTSKGKTISDIYATILWDTAKAILAKTKRSKMRADNADGDPDFENHFYILRKTICPAVLTENLFMDNEEDCRFLLSQEGKDAVVRIHVEGIKKIINLS